MGDAVPRFALLAAVVMAASFLLAAWSFQQAHRSGCEARNVTLNVLAAVLTDARDQTAANGNLSPRAKRFYTAELARISAVRC